MEFSLVFICINVIIDIILNMNNFLISGSSLIKILALEVGDEYILFSEVLKVLYLFLVYKTSIFIKLLKLIKC
jgi:hypothetical protein